VVPLRLDDSPLPPFWDSRLYLDFRGKARPEGETLDRLIWALLGRTPPAPESADSRVVKAERESTDKLLQEIRIAALVGGHRVNKLWQSWRSSGVTTDSASLVVAEVLLDCGEADDALEVLKQCSDGIRAKQLNALALKRMNRQDEAIQILVELYETGQLDPETAGILAGIYKRKWQEGQDRAALIKACTIYSTTFDRSGSPYNGINAAALALWRGLQEESSRIAQKVLDVYEGKQDADLKEWDRATKGEAFLLVGDLESARTWYEAEVCLNPEKLVKIAVMRRQARINLTELGLKRDALDSSLPVPGIAVFSGHMTDAPERAQPRFPSAKEGKVRLALREKLKAHKIGIGFSSAARGGDILFIEELLNRHGDAKVYLPFARDAFARTSVGAQWKKRYEAVLAQEHVELKELSSAIPKPADEPDAYAACNEKIRKEAMTLSREIDEQPVLITVWDEKAGPRGGTSEVVASWQQEGFDPENINPVML
jgi:predicted negative regulator of RcsB-dependent stress response